MANNCLVTKLKDVVDNNNLLKLGEVGLKGLRASWGPATIRSLEPFEIKAFAGTPYLVDENDNQVQSIQSNASTSVVFKPIGGGVDNNIIITNKYNIVYISTLNNIETSALKYMPIETLYFTSLVGDFKDVVGLSRLSTLECPNLNDLRNYTLENITALFNSHNNLTRVNLPGGGTGLPNIGTASDMGNIMTSRLGYLGLGYGMFVGDIKDIAKSARAKGITSHSMDIGCSNDENMQHTFNGTPMPAWTTTYKSFSWTENTITYDGVTINE